MYWCGPVLRCAFSAFAETQRHLLYNPILDSAASRMHHRIHCYEIPPIAFSPDPCKLGYRFLPWNPEVENLVGVPTGIEPASPAIQADMLTTTPQRPGTNSVEFALSHSTMDYWWNRWKVWGALYMSLNMYTQDVILEHSGKVLRLTAMTPGGTCVTHRYPL